jgi:hypothetical protein
MHAVRTSQKLPHRRFSTVTFGQQRGENVARDGRKRCCWPRAICHAPFLSIANEVGLSCTRVSYCNSTRHDLASLAPEGSEHRCNHAGATRDASHQNRSGNHSRKSAAPGVFRHPADLLYPGAKPRARGRVRDSCRARRKNGAAIFPPKDETERPTNAASRGTYWSAEAYWPRAGSNRVSLAPFLIDSSLLFRIRLRSPRRDRIGLLLQLRQPGRAWRDDLRSPNTIFRKYCHRHLFRAVDPVPDSR